MIHVDTSFLVDLLRESSEPRRGPATEMLETLEDEILAVSVFVACELHAGAQLSDRPARERGKVDQLLGAVELRYPSRGFEERYGQTLAPLQREGRKIGTMDLLIGTHALEDEAPLLTGNVEHFERIPGLRLLTHL